MKPTILLTGATGFVGLRYVEYNKEHYNIRPLSLQKTKVEDVDFSNMDAVVHLAGMAHQMQKIDPQIYFDVNFDLTKALAIRAKAAGVKQFIFVSTIKVFGEHHTSVLNEKSPCEPINDPYGQSKLDAEEFLKTLEDDSFTVAIVRPPLIYGPNVKGNLIRFLKLADTNYPLPFKGIDNRRTMVFLDNLIALLNTIVDKKSSGLYLASDNQPISTTYLISEMRIQMGKSPNLFAIPSLFTSILSKVKPEFALRLYGSLEMDATESNKKINFTPPYSIEEGIKTMVQWYKTTA
jgi:nucleoside-diphosphate-sugar epimerase